MHCRLGEKAIPVKLPILISQSVLGILLLVVSISALAETTFTYQGRLSQSGEPANGIYDMRFNLFDAVIAGSLIGPTVNQTGVKVLDGVFNVMLDFGDSPFGADPRWLRIEVKEAGGGAYVALFPRQRVGASPFAIETLAVAPGAVDTAAIEDGAVTRSKIALNAVGNAQIENNTIVSADIRDGTITSDDINGSIYSRKPQVYSQVVTGDVSFATERVTVGCLGGRDLLIQHVCNVPSETSDLIVLSERLTNVDNDIFPAQLVCTAQNRDPQSLEVLSATVWCLEVP